MGLECSQGLESRKSVSAGNQGAEGLAREETLKPGMRSGLGSRKKGRLEGMRPWSGRAERSCTVGWHEKGIEYIQ